MPNSIIWISEPLLEKLVALAMELHPKETGGILMGYRNEGDAVVTDLIGPGPKAEHRSTGFIPDYDYHDQMVAKVYETSERRVTYLGDWHTHPNSKAYLSRQDKSTLKKIADYEPARNPHPYMMILGTFPFEIEAWTLIAGTLFQRTVAKSIVRLYN